MEILNLVWDQYLYIPLFNLLIWLYLNFSFFNLGIAVIILTIILRIVLLPLSYMTERAKIVRQQLDAIGRRSGLDRNCCHGTGQ